MSSGKRRSALPADAQSRPVVAELPAHVVAARWVERSGNSQQRKLS